jgi:hypothetical protein
MCEVFFLLAGQEKIGRTKIPSPTPFLFVRPLFLGVQEGFAPLIGR